MKQKEQYTLEELYDNLAITISELSGIAHMSEATIRRIRYGCPARRSTANKLLLAFSKVYDRELSLDNVTGIQLEDKREIWSQKRGASITEKAEKPPALPQVVQTKTVTEKAPKRDYTPRAEEIPEDLPEGTVFHFEFTKQYGIDRKTFEGWIEKGYIHADVRPKENRPRETNKFMTPENQAHALEWIRANKPKYLQNE